MRNRKPRQYCAGNHGAACVRNGTPHDLCDIMGPIPPMPREYAARIVANGAGGSPEYREALIDRMVRHGECLWHAAAMVMNQRCACAACTNSSHPAHAWSISDVEAA